MAQRAAQSLYRSIGNRSYRKPLRPVLDGLDPINSGQVLCYACTENQKAALTDLSPLKQNATVSGGPFLPEIGSRGGNAPHLTFNGSYQNAGSVPINGASGFTIYMRLWDDGSGTNPRVISIADSTVLLTQFSGSNTISFSNNGAGNNVVATLTSGQWNDLFAVGDGGSGGTLYVNSTTAAASGSLGGGPSTGPIGFGDKSSAAGDRVWSGRYDCIRIWNRQLSAAEMARLMAYPWAGLVSREISYLIGATSSLITVTMDFIASLEFGSSLKGDGICLTEPGQIFSKDGASLQESGATVRLAASAPGEFGELASQTDAILAEILSTLADTINASVDSGETVLGAGGIPADMGILARLDGAMLDETGATVRADSVAATEYGRATQISATIPADFGQNVGLTITVPLEFSGSGTTISLDIGVPLDWGSSQSATVLTPLENGSAIAAISSVLSAMGSSLSLDTPVSLAALATGNRDIAASVEILAALRRDGAVPAEFSLRLSADILVNVEFDGTTATLRLTVDPKFALLAKPRTSAILARPRTTTILSG